MASNATTNDIIKNFDNLTPGHKMMVLQNCISNLSFSDKKGLQNFIYSQTKPKPSNKFNAQFKSTRQFKTLPPDVLCMLDKPLQVFSIDVSKISQKCSKGLQKWPYMIIN